MGMGQTIEEWTNNYHQTNNNKEAVQAVLGV